MITVFENLDKIKKITELKTKISSKDTRTIKRILEDSERNFYKIITKWNTDTRCQNCNQNITTVYLISPKKWAETKLDISLKYLDRREQKYTQRWETFVRFYKLLLKRIDKEYKFKTMSRPTVSCEYILEKFKEEIWSNIQKYKNTFIPCLGSVYNLNFQ